MVKNKLYLFPYGQDKCHTAYSLQIMYIFTQLLHYWDRLLFSPLYSLTLQDPISPSCAPAGPASPQPYLPPGWISLYLHVLDLSGKLQAMASCRKLVFCQGIFLGILDYSCSFMTKGPAITFHPYIMDTNGGYRRKITSSQPCSLPMMRFYGPQPWSSMAVYDFCLLGLMFWFGFPIF